MPSQYRAVEPKFKRNMTAPLAKSGTATRQRTGEKAGSGPAGYLAGWSNYSPRGWGWIALPSESTTIGIAGLFRGARNFVLKSIFYLIPRTNAQPVQTCLFRTLRLGSHRISLLFHGLLPSESTLRPKT